MINVVWLKRDIRAHDHAALAAAEAEHIPYVVVYLFEPELINMPDTSLRHLQFQYFSVLDIIKNRGLALNIAYIDALEFFSYIHTELKINKVFSYQESGLLKTWERDKKLSAYFKNEGIIWIEFQRDGIQRGIKNRVKWDKDWFIKMHAYPLENTFEFLIPLPTENPFHLPKEFQKELENYPPDFQPAGESFAFKYLSSFVNKRAANYSRNISKPALSRESCSRLSPYLAWGNLSLRVAYLNMYAQVKNPQLSFGIKNAITRLKWHCHFIQKFEMDCSYASHNLNPAYDNFKWRQNEDFLLAWKNGETGFPLVDACMKCLHKTGWINFRMRSMLVSFLCHHLLLDWREGVNHLAQLFLDYEPGIHYTQFQMQASTTGINTVRIYNPIKQSEDQDPEGVFIKKYLPQLSALPLEYLHQPWSMPLALQKDLGLIIGKDYPDPIVSFDENLKEIRPLLWAMHKSPEVKINNHKILKKHARPSLQHS